MIRPTVPYSFKGLFKFPTNCLVCDDAERVEGEEGTHGMLQNSDDQVGEIRQDPKCPIL